MSSEPKLPGLLAVATILLLIGCGGSTDEPRPTTSQSQVHVSSGFSLNRDPSRPTALSRDGTIALDLPAGWSAARVSSTDSSLTVGSFRLPRRVAGPCVPAAALSRMPTDGALIRVSETETTSAKRLAEALEPRPADFRLGKPTVDYKCGFAFSFEFRQKGRGFLVWVWVHRKDMRQPVHGVPGKPMLGDFNPRTRRQITHVLDSLQVTSAGAEPVRIPTIALDCRLPANVLGCDRIMIAVSTRVPMEKVAVQVRRWAAKTPRGWVYSDPVPGKAIWLSGGNQPRSDSNGLHWGGVKLNAGLARSTSTVPVRLPTTGHRWVGNNPRIRADLEVTYRRTGDSPDASTRGRADFRRIELLAGWG